MLPPFGVTHHPALQESGQFGREQHTILIGISVAFESLQELHGEQPMATLFVDLFARFPGGDDLHCGILQNEPQVVGIHALRRPGLGHRKS